MINYIFASGPAPCSGPDCPVGVLLDGEPDSLAVTATSKYGPFPADPDEIDSTGLMLTRLSATLHPQATIGEINAALTAISGKISWMNPGDLDVTVIIPAVANRAAADSLAAMLVQSRAFLFATAEFLPSLNAAQSGAELPPSETAFIDHLLKLRMPAAWNAKGRAEQVNQVVTMFVPDGYDSPTPHPEIPSQTFIVGSGNPEESAASGNHGFSVCGIVGSEHDTLNTTGIHPLDQLLSIRSMMTGGQTMNETCDQIAKQMPSGRFVLNTSIGYPDDLSGTSKLTRIKLGMRWRKQVLSRQNDFIHVASAGNEGANTDESQNANLNSPWNTAAAFDSPFDAFTPGELDFLDSIALQLYWNNLVAGDPFMTVKLNNVLVVGSSDSTGSPSTFSCPTFGMGSFSVRVLGEDVAAPCVRPEDDGCALLQNGLHREEVTGTSFAAPQVAGLAAYMLNLDSTLSNNEIKAIIRNAYEDSPNPGFVDAYAAVLAVDPTLADANVRFSLLDVVDADLNNIPDGFFDENDLREFLIRFASYEQARIDDPNLGQDHSRFDLNGDGYTGGTNHVARFDLDINYPAPYSPVAVPFGADELIFDENTLVDLDILCYYAHTALYSGSDSVRNELLIDCPCSQVESRDAQCNRCFEPISELWAVPERYNDIIASVYFGGSVCRNPSLVKSSQEPQWADSLSLDTTCSLGGSSGRANSAASISEEYDPQLNTWTLSAIHECKSWVWGPTPTFLPADQGHRAVSDSRNFYTLRQLTDTCDLQYTARIKTVVYGSPPSDSNDQLGEWHLVGLGRTITRPFLSSGTHDTTFTGDLIDAYLSGEDSYFILRVTSKSNKTGLFSNDDSSFVTCTVTVVVEPKPTAAKALIRSRRMAPLPESSLLQTPVPAAIIQDHRSKERLAPHAIDPKRSRSQ
jgi:hypothetical protein